MNLILTTDATTVILKAGSKNFLHAQVHLIIPKDGQLPARHLESIKVTLLCKENLSFPGGSVECNQWQPSTSVTDVARATLRPGNTYTWEVRIEIPDDMATYERCRAGFCYQNLRADAVFPGFRPFRKVLSTEKTIFLVTAPESIESFCHSYCYNGWVEDLGPVAVKTQSQHLTVGGYLRAAVEIPAASPGVTVDAIEINLLQAMKLQSRSRPHVQAQLSGHRVNLVQSVDEIGAIMQWTIRLPKDTMIRPSTTRSRNSIQISHQLEVRILFSVPTEQADDCSGGQGRRKRAHILTKPLHIPSCAFKPATLHLPAYSEFDPSPVPAQDRDQWSGRNQHLSHDHCVCGQSTDEVLSVEGDIKDISQMSDIPFPMEKS